MMKKLRLLSAVLFVSTHLLQAQPASGMLPRQEDERCRQWVDQTFAQMDQKEKIGQLFVYTLEAKMDRETQKQVKQLAKKYKIGALLYSQGTVDEQAQLTNLAQRNAKVPLMISFDGEWGVSMRLTGTPLFPMKAALGCIEDSTLMEEYWREVIREFHEMGVQADFTHGLESDKISNDMIPVRKEINKAIQTVLDALAAGSLSQGEVDAKCRKILTHKYLLGLNQRSSINTDNLTHRVNTPEAQALAARLRKAAITVLGNHFNVLPLTTEKPIALLSVGEADIDQPFIDQLKQHTPTECFRMTKQTSADERNQIAEKLRSFHRVVISVTTPDGLSINYQPLMDGLNLQMSTVYVFFTSYQTLVPLEAVLTKSSAVVLAHTAQEDVQRYVADVIVAKESAQGKLSMPVGNLFRPGQGVAIVPGMSGRRQPEDDGMKGYLLHRIDSVVQEGLAAGAYPGCQVLVLKGGNPVYDRCFGTYSDKDKTPVRPTDLYDLDALTKTTATLLAVMKLCDEGRLKLTDRAATFLPWLQNSTKKSITIQELLLHESGLLPYIRFYRDAIDERTVEGPLAQGFVDQWHRTRIGQYTYACSDFKYKKGLISSQQTSTHTLNMAEGLWLNKSFKQTILQTIARSEMDEKRFVYSDLGFIVLQQVVEAITKRPMNEYLAATFYTPMGLTRTLFRPLGDDPSRVSSGSSSSSSSSSSPSSSNSSSSSSFPKSEIIPTANNDFLRRQDLCGYVQEEAAAFLGGVSGNAGLFSTAREVGQVYQMLLNGGELNGKRYLSEAICKQFTTVTAATSHRGLGFDKPNRLDPKATACALPTPVEVYGHTGSTGTCAWADPTNGLVYVFLSNRSCPDGWNGKLNSMKIRQGIQEVIYRSILLRK